MDEAPAHIYQAGESWHEAPGDHHVISENASSAELAKLLAVFVANSSDGPLTVPDHN